MRKVKFSKLLCQSLVFLSILAFWGKDVYATAGGGSIKILPGIESSDPVKIYKDWSLIIETDTHIEISARVLKCSMMGTNQVHLRVFNENSVTKTIKFKVEIIDLTDQRSIVKEITINAAIGAMYIPDCENGNPLMKSLKVDLPNDYNPNNLTINVSIIQ